MEVPKYSWVHRKPEVPDQKLEARKGGRCAALSAQAPPLL